MIESPLLDELRAEWKAEDVLEVLRTRFGEVPPELAASLRAVRTADRLTALLQDAVRCTDLRAFESQLRP